MIYETDTNRVLVWDNAAWVMIADTDQPPGLQLIKTQTIGTAVSSVTVTDAFSAEYDNYKILVTGGVGSSDQNLQMRLGASATGYYASLFYKAYSAADGTSVESYGNNNTAFWTRAGVVTTNNIYANIELLGPNQAKVTGMSSQYITAITTSGSGTHAGFHNVATAFTGFTLTPTGGTMTGGTIKVYGYRN
jgi:hypothetical protein